MKNLLIYINPEKAFDAEYKLMAKVQIDNSLRLGWDKGDIVIAMNFPYEYNGVKAMVVGDDLYCQHHAQLSKVNVIRHLFREGIVGDELWWFHDFDAFQNCNMAPFLETGIDAGFTDYGYKAKWNTGSFFFVRDAGDLFAMMGKIAYHWRTNEEIALGMMTARNTNRVNDRTKKFGVTYNMPGCRDGMRHLHSVYRAVSWDGLPVKVLHFHPLRRGGRYYQMMVGDNPLDVKLMTDGLEKVFNDHGCS